MDALGVRHGSSVEQVLEKLLQIDFGLRDFEIAGVLDALHGVAGDEMVPIESRPCASLQGGRSATLRPVFVFLSIQGCDGEARDRDLDDAGHETAAGSGFEAGFSQGALYVSEGKERV